MQINLTELFTRDGKELDVTAEVEMTRFHTAEGDYELADQTPAKLHLTNAGNRTI